MNNTTRLRAIELARKGMFVPESLTAEMLNKIDIKAGSSVLVLFSYEMLFALFERGVKDVTLFFDKPRKSIRNIATSLGYKVIEELENDMKFDVIVGNPPFSKKKTDCESDRGGVNLYPTFYRHAVDIADTVAMIMPRTEKKTLMKEHNALVSQANILQDISGDKFPSIALDTWYVIKDNSNKTHNKTFITNEINNPLPWEKGRISTTTLATERKSLDDVTVYHKLNRRDGLLKKYMPQKDLKTDKHRHPSNGYVVIMPRCIQTYGWIDVRIQELVADEPFAAFSSINLMFLDTKEQCIELVEYMKTKDFIEQVLSRITGFGNVSKSNLQSVVIPEDVLDRIRTPTNTSI